MADFIKTYAFSNFRNQVKSSGTIGGNYFKAWISLKLKDIIILHSPTEYFCPQSGTRTTTDCTRPALRTKVSIPRVLDIGLFSFKFIDKCRNYRKKPLLNFSLNRNYSIKFITLFISARADFKTPVESLI